MVKQYKITIAQREEPLLVTRPWYYMWYDNWNSRVYKKVGGGNVRIGNHWLIIVEDA